MAFRVGIALVFSLAFFLRAACLVGLLDTHLLTALVGDAELYDIWARKILSEGWLGTEVFFQAPLYPYFIAVVYAVFGPDLMALRWVQIVMGSAACALTADAGRSFFSPKAGLASGFLLAGYPIAIYYDILIQKAVLGLFFTALLLFLLGRLSKGAGWVLWPVVGLVLGGLVLVRENALILLPVILLWVFIGWRNTTSRRRAVWALAVALGVSAVLFPVALRNRVVGGGWFLTTSNLGFNLYMGNHAEATGTYSALVTGQGDWRFERDDARRLAETETGRPLTDKEVSAYWQDKALEAVRSDPVGWLQLLMRKWRLLWGSLEMSDAESIYAYRDFSPILRGLGAFYHFGTLLPLAVVGMALTWGDRRRLLPLYLILAAYAAGILPFYVMDRYRQPMVAVLIPFVGAGILEAVRLASRKEFRKLAVALALAGVVAVYSNRPVMDRSAVAATTYYNWASVFENSGRADAAAENYRKALKLDPGHPLALNNLGILHCAEGDFEEGIRLFEKALAADPAMAKTHNNLAIAHYHTGNLEKALKHFQETLRLDPGYEPSVHYNLACILSLKGEVSAAMDQLEQAFTRGYADWGQILTDPDLENVRRSPRFENLRRAAEAGGGQG